MFCEVRNPHRQSGNECGQTFVPEFADGNSVLCYTAVCIGWNKEIDDTRGAAISLVK